MGGTEQSKDDHKHINDMERKCTSHAFLMGCSSQKHKLSSYMGLVFSKCFHVCYLPVLGGKEYDYLHLSDVRSEIQ